MKIQKLVIHNIASIEDATIDFSAAPLSGSDVFLITGETGSGKSTLLDAICLALYRSTPRLKNTRMQGAVADAGKEVQISDPVQLLRENTGEGFVSLSFEGSNGIPYQAEWSVARARNKPTGRIQGKKWTLKDLQSGITYTRDTEVEAEIARAVRLSFEQFCRTTMLAQGEFTRFLNSKDEEKAEILEMITGADIYSRIGAKVYAITQEKEKAFEEAKAAVEGISLLTPEQREEKRLAIAELHKKAQALVDTRTRCQEKVRWLVAEAELANRIGEARTSLSEAEEAARAGLQHLQARVQGIQDELTGIEAFLEKERPDLPLLQRAQTVEGQLAVIEAGSAAVAAGKGELAALDKQLAEVLVPAKEAAGKAFSDAGKARETAGETLRKAEDALKAAGLPELRAGITRLTAEIGAFRLAGDRIVRHRQTGKDWQAEEDAIQAKAQELSALRASREGLVREVEELRIHAEVERRIYERESMAGNAAVTALRSKLAVGCLCPVCLQEIKSALPTDAEVAARLLPLQQASEAASQLFETRQQALRTLEATLLAEERELTRRKDRHGKDDSVRASYTAVLEVLQTCGIPVYDADTETLLREKLRMADLRLRQLNADETAGKALETAARNARMAGDEAVKAWEKRQHAFGEAEKALADTKAARDTRCALLEARTKDLAAAEETVKGLVKGSRWEADWYQDRKAFGKALAEAVKAHDAALRQQQALQEEKKAVSDTISALQSLLSEADGAHRDAVLVEKQKGLETPHEGIGAALVVARATLASLQQQAEEQAARRPAFGEGETLEGLKAAESDCEEALLQGNAAATLLEQELKQDAAAAAKLGELAARAEALREVWLRWNRLNDLIGDNTGKKFRKIAQSYVLGSLVAAANRYMRELTDRYALKVVPGTFIISVEDAYQGFVSRPASTISGGESFLVSLSLALALSDIGDSLSVDTLFIDEGFGTLSGAPLQSAVNTLKSLHTKAGRHVGIISHIEELQEKIPVRIQVERNGKSASSTVKVVPEVPMD